MSRPSFDERMHDLDLVRSAIRVAGERAMVTFRSDHTPWHKAPGQVVTEADIAIDRLLYDRLIGARPDYGWLSEETADTPERLDRARVWVVDPIDGTRAFVEGRPEFAVSVALVEDGLAVLGMIFNPATEELFEAVRGGGAFLNGERLHTGNHGSVEGAQIVFSRGEIAKKPWGSWLPGAELQTIGSLAYKLALVAAGRFDALASLRQAQEWDIAAGHIVLEESGAFLSQASGRLIIYNHAKPIQRGLVAANLRLHDHVVRALGARDR